MKKLIHEVIELDKQAQAEISLLKKEKEELFLAFKAMKKELTDKYKKDIDMQTAQLEKDADQLFLERLKAYEEKTALKEKNIQVQYEKNKDIWLKELMDFILGELS